MAVGLDDSLAAAVGRGRCRLPARAACTTRSWTASCRPTAPSSPHFIEVAARRGAQPVHRARRAAGLPGRRGLRALARASAAPSTSPRSRRRDDGPPMTTATAPPPLRDRIAGAPISWGVCEVPGLGPPARPRDGARRRCASVGLAATEFGPDGFLPDDPAGQGGTLRRRRAARPSASSCRSSCTTPAHDPLPEVEPALEASSPPAPPPSSLAAATGAEGYDDRPVLDDAGWATLLPTSTASRDAAAAHGLLATLHPHVGTMVETRRGDRPGAGRLPHRRSASTPATCSSAAATRSRVARRAPRRIGHVHLKDVRARPSPAQVQRRRGHLHRGRRARACTCPLGAGRRRHRRDRRRPGGQRVRRLVRPRAGHHPRRAPRPSTGRRPGSVDVRASAAHILASPI